MDISLSDQMNNISDLLCGYTTAPYEDILFRCHRLVKLEKNSFFKFDTSAWRTGKIRFMAPEEQGVFITLCCLIWDGNGEHEIDDFSHRHCNTGQPLFNQCVQALTGAGLLLNDDGVLSVAFISEQLCAYDEYREQQAEKGRKSAEVRKRNQPLSTKKKEERRKKKEECREKREDKTHTPQAAGYSEQFEAIWLLYQRKGTKKPAYAQWKKLSEKEKDDAVAALSDYFKEEPTKKFRKDFERYLGNHVFEGVLERKATGCLNIPVDSNRPSNILTGTKDKVYVSPHSAEYIMNRKNKEI